MSQRYSLAVLEGADPTTFIAINNSHGKDASQVFKKSLPITHADPATFKLWSEGYAADATQVFYGRTRLEDAELDRARCDAVLWRSNCCHLRWIKRRRPRLLPLLVNGQAREGL